MPRIQLGGRTNLGGVPAIGDLRNLVWIATTVERPDPATPSTIVNRPGVFQTHARIRNLRPYQILNYQAVFGSERIPTIEVTIRNPPDVKVDLNHWVYRENGPAQFWYKVRSTEDLGAAGRWLVLNCSIDEVRDQRTDPATQEPPSRWEDPSTVVDRI
jgi:hypothetical protein